MLHLAITAAAARAVTAPDKAASAATAKATTAATAAGLAQPGKAAGVRAFRTITGLSALSYAVDLGCTAAVAASLSAGADVDGISLVTALRIGDIWGAVLATYASTDSRAEPLLLRAALLGHAAIVQLLLQAGAYKGLFEAAVILASEGLCGQAPRQTPAEGSSPYAPAGPVKLPSSTVDLLHARKQAFRLAGVSDWANTVLTPAGNEATRSSSSSLNLRRQNKALQLMVQAAASEQHCQPGSETVLHKAVQHGFPAVVALLLRHGAPVNVHDSKNCTPLFYAVEWLACGCRRIMRQQLLQAGADTAAVMEYLATQGPPGSQLSSSACVSVPALLQLLDTPKLTGEMAEQGLRAIAAAAAAQETAAADAMQLLLGGQPNEPSCSHRGKQQQRPRRQWRQQRRQQQQ